MFMSFQVDLAETSIRSQIISRYVNPTGDAPICPFSCCKKTRQFGETPPGVLTPSSLLPLNKFTFQTICLYEYDKYLRSQKIKQDVLHIDKKLMTRENMGGKQTVWKFIGTMLPFIRNLHCPGPQYQMFKNLNPPGKGVKFVQNHQKQTWH